ncbi:hypothetical protein D3C80_1436610 [compost metagenome]
MRGFVGTPGQGLSQRGPHACASAGQQGLDMHGQRLVHGASGRGQQLDLVGLADVG